MGRCRKQRTQLLNLAQEEELEEKSGEIRLTDWPPERGAYACVHSGIGMDVKKGARMRERRRRGHQAGHA